MNYKDYLNSKCNEFLAAIEQCEGVTEIPTKDYGWENYRYESPHFRLAHVERYSDDKIEVLHVTTFPRNNFMSPIFGFDVIATDKKVLGCYMDLSPVISYTPYLLETRMETFNYEWKIRKELPKWSSDIFSEDFLLIEPADNTEFVRFCMMGVYNYLNYLIDLPLQETPIYSEEITRAQNRYCEVQASNPRTYNVLKTKLGEEQATEFMQQVLFPKIQV